MGTRPALNRDEARVLKEMLRLGDEATSDLLAQRGRQLGWRYVDVRKALRGMEAKGYVRKTLDAGRNVTWRRIIRQEPLLHEMAFGVVGHRYWGTCSCGWRRWAAAGDIAGEDDVRERAFQHPVRWPRRTWGQQGPLQLFPEGPLRLPRLVLSINLDTVATGIDERKYQHERSHSGDPARDDRVRPAAGRPGRVAGHLRLVRRGAA
jgi:hypothetical protein